jgi:hypothetical protein
MTHDEAWVTWGWSTFLVPGRGVTWTSMIMTMKSFNH